MPRLRKVVAAYGSGAGQDAPPTEGGGVRGARCPAYGRWWRKRGQDAPPTEGGGVRGARCPAYKARRSTVLHEFSNRYL